MKYALDDSKLCTPFPPTEFHEKICVYKKVNILNSVFSHIRNAFAHGRFNIVDDEDDTIFVLEDVAGKTKTKVSARMILKKSTLLKWIEIIEGGEKSLSE